MYYPLLLSTLESTSWIMCNRTSKTNWIKCKRFNGESVCVDFSSLFYNDSYKSLCASSLRQRSDKSTSQVQTGRERVQTNSPYLLARREPLLPSYQTVMTELSVAVTQRNTLALINPPLPLLCSPNPISAPLCLLFLQSYQMDCPIQREREAGGLRENKNDVRLGYWWIPEGSEHCSERKRDIRRGETGGGGGKLPSLCKGWSTLKVSVAEEQCGKCDHSFNLKLSGVNKECVAGRRRGQDYWAPLCCSSLPPLLQKHPTSERL